VPLEAWLPVGFALPDGARTRRVLQAGTAWQIVETATKGRALIVTQELATSWVDAGLVNLSEWQSFRFGTEAMYALASSPNSALAPVNDSRSPSNKNEALAFAVSLRETRAIDSATPLQEAIYIEQLSRILPTYALSAPISDDVVLGSWLAGGVQVSVYSTRRIHQLLSWLGNSNLEDVIKQSGLQPASGTSDTQEDNTGAKPPFTLAGRPALEQFFNEHVIDIIEHADRYRALGIEFPSAIILHGPPGCGKTFAVDRLVEYLGWPSFSIDATSIGSPYIHETSRKVAEVFDKAMKEAPSVLVIDEMEAFLSDREMGAASSHHRVEEVGEFLRRIPEAIHRRVLIVAMTNRLEMIDPAIQRRGRFDHVVLVGMPSRDEVEGLLKKLLEKVPTENLDISTIANALTGRPLSDVAFVTREAARLAARSGRHSIDQISLLAAVKSAPPRAANTEPRKIGFT
jgi:cell division protease FtsH